MKYKLGNLKLNNRIFLAPMLEPNDIAFRLLCKRAGCGLTYGGMTSALSRAKIHLDDKPILQLFGNSSRGIKNFMNKYDSKVSGWDFNLGCPSKLSRKLGHGACLNNLNIIRDILEVMRENTKKPLTIKIRKSDFSFDILKICEEVGVDGICIHARTVSQGYSGEVDYDFALEVKRQTEIPVIFSGVSDVADVDSILQDFDFVMIGRCAIGRPEIFSGLVNGQWSVVERCHNFNSHFRFGDYLKLAKKYKLYFRQIKYQAMNFTKGIPNGKSLRVKLISANDVEEIEDIFGSNK